MDTETKLRKLGEARSLLESSGNQIYEAGNLINEVNGLITGVVGNPFKGFILILNEQIDTVVKQAKELRDANKPPLSKSKLKKLPEDHVTVKERQEKVENNLNPSPYDSNGDIIK